MVGPDDLISGSVGGRKQSLGDPVRGDKGGVNYFLLMGVKGVNSSCGMFLYCLTVFK